MTTYYAVCNVYGPISVRIEAADDAEAREKFEALDQRAAIDGQRTDAEDDLDICGDGMSEEEFDAALEAAGYTTACDLSPIVNAHAGTVAHLADGWRLWREAEAEALAVPDITAEDRRLLGELCTRSDSGKHFTETFPAEWLDRMEDAGIITISRPTHSATGIPYSQEYWSVGIMPNVPGITDEHGCLIGVDD